MNEKDELNEETPLPPATSDEISEWLEPDAWADDEGLTSEAAPVT